ncbi:MAG TPA: hypothetical protein VF119_09540, partial [Candidatus Limnocylindrales bacterium]
ASIGSAVALLIFALVTAGHLRIAGDTGARRGILWVALIAVLVALVTFIVTTLVQEPASVVTLLVILGVSIALDLGWSRRHPHAQKGGPA